MKRLLIIPILVLLVVPSDARAQDGLLPLVVQESGGVEQSGGAEFWWSGGPPAWTDFDRELQRAMGSAGHAMVQPSQAAHISKIYRRADLSETNAVALGSVLGASRVLLGRVVIEPLPGRPLGLAGARVVVEVALLEKGAEGVKRLAEFVVERVAYDADPAAATEGARRSAARAVVGQVASGPRRVSGPIGVAAAEPLVVVSAPSRAALEAVKAQLAAAPEVDRVEVRWAAEGLVALELNPQGVDSRAVVHGAASRVAQDPPPGLLVVTLPPEGDDLHLEVKMADSNP